MKSSYLIRILCLILILASCEAPQTEEEAAAISGEESSKDKTSHSLKSIKMGSLSDCSKISAEELEKLNALEKEVKESTFPYETPASPLGKFHKDAFHHKLIELSRRGCASSLEALIVYLKTYIASSEEHNVNVDLNVNSNIILPAIFTGFKIIGFAEPVLMDLLNKIDSSKEGDALYPLRDYARDVLSYFKINKIENFINYDAILIPFKESWNYDSYTCSPDYLLPNGQRVGFISNWIGYKNDVMALEPLSDDIFFDYLYEKFYCDGVNGYSVHLLITNKFDLNLSAKMEQEAIAALKYNNIRGGVIGKSLTKRFSSSLVSVQLDIQNWLEFVEAGPNYLVDEEMRREIISLLEMRCHELGNEIDLKARKSCFSLISPTLYQIVQEDPYYTVRLRAAEVISRNL